jgi:hypothetical protein
MNVLLLLLMLSDCPMHAKHTATAVDHRGDQVMGFSHEKTKHSFKLYADGGAVEVRGEDPESIAAIRAHLQVIAKDFAAGNFEKPREIHDRVVPGVPVLKELGAKVSYTYEELERGARVRIRTAEKRGIEAVHEFMRFQIEDHRTGDTTTVQ